MPPFSKSLIKGAVLLAAMALPPLFSGASHAAGEVPAPELRLSIMEGVEMVLENSLDVTIERLSPEAARHRVMSQEGAFDVEAFGSFKREDSETPLASRSSAAARGLASIESESYSLEAGLTGKTSIGTTYTLEVTDNWASDTLSNFEFEYTSFAGVTVVQPLLRGLGSDANLRELNIARKDRDISEHRFRDTVLGAVSSFEQSYWDLVAARMELDVRAESLRLAEKLLADNRARYRAGVAPSLDITQSEAAVAARKDDIIVAKKTVREKENTLKLLISRDVYAIRAMEIVPLDKPRVEPVEANLERSIEEAFRSRPDYLEAKAEIEKQDVRVRYAENQLYPKIDLEASYGLSGLGDGIADSFSGFEENPRWSLGLALRYPLGNRTSLGEARAARIESQQTLLRLKKLEQEIILRIDNAIKDIAADRERVEAARIATRLAEEALKAEEKKLEAGRSTSYNVLKLQEELARARSNEVAAITGYNKSVAAYLREKGVLLEERGIRIRR